MSDEISNITPLFPEVSEDRGAPAVTPEVSEVKPWVGGQNELKVVILGSPHASAAIARRNAKAARAVEGVEAILFAEDLGRDGNTAGKYFQDEPLLADDQVCYIGQPVALIVGRSLEACYRARDEVQMVYHETPGISTLEHALAMKSYHGSSQKIEQGNAASAIDQAPNRLKGSLLIGSQRPCLATAPRVRVSWSRHGEAASVEITAELPTEVRRAVAQALELAECQVAVESEAVSGPAAAMELEPVRLAALAAHAARVTRSAVELVVDQDSPLYRGQRHATRASYEVGFDENGQLYGLDLRLAVDAGYFVADSEVVLDRAMLHSEGPYHIPNFRVRGVLCRTNSVSSSAMPSEGSAQGAWVVEEVMTRVADHLVLPAHEVREINFFDPEEREASTAHGQPLMSGAMQRIWGHAIKRSQYYQRFQEIQDWNDRSRNYKRGIAITPMRFGFGDPRQERNCGTVLLQVMPDGSIQVRPGVADLQDGLSGQIQEEVAARLGVEPQVVRVLLGDFEVLPQVTPTSGVDMAGIILRAVDDACEQMVERLRLVAMQLFVARGESGIDAETIAFAKGLVGSRVGSVEPISFVDLVAGACERRENLMVTGYHRTANVWWDRERGEGSPFSAFTYAAAVAEVQIDTFTGETQVLRVDIAHEGAPTVNQGARDTAQLARAFGIGAGWVTTEAVPDSDLDPGENFQAEHGVGGFSSFSCVFETDRLRPSSPPQSAPGAPCSEAPVLLGSSVRYAIWNALQEFAETAQIQAELPLPATPPQMLDVLKQISLQMQQQREIESQREVVSGNVWDVG